MAELARATPEDRNRVIDLMRFTALICVVLGHWLMQGLYLDGEGGPHRQGLLSLAAWTHPLTWLLQVMPIFFVVGGYSNAHSWRRATREQLGYGTWLHARVTRLTRPLLPLLVWWSVVGPAVLITGADQDWLRIAARASLVPTWFLATYVVVVALTPLTLRLWDRCGLWSIVGGVLLAVGIDLVSLATEAGFVGMANGVIVWVSLHQLGYAWLDRALPRRRAAGLALGSFVALVAAVWLGPYAVSMVGVTGFGVDNTFPPRATILALGLWQASTALACEPALQRLVRRPRVWFTVVAVESRIMTIYLWHMTAIGIVVAASMWSGVGLTARPDTAAWWWGRPPWFVMLAAVTVLLTVVVGRFENPPDHVPAPMPAWGAVGEVTVLAVAIAIMAMFGLVLPNGDVVWCLPLATALFLLVVGTLISRRS